MELGDGDGLGLGEGLGVGEGGRLGEALGLGEGEGLGDGLAVGLGVGVAPPAKLTITMLVGACRISFTVAPVGFKTTLESVVSPSAV